MNDDFVDCDGCRQVVLRDTLSACWAGAFCENCVTDGCAYDECDHGEVRDEPAGEYDTSGSDPEPVPDLRPRIVDPSAAAQVVSPVLRGRDRETCVVLVLDTRHRLIEAVTNSVGTVEHTFMNAREVLRDVLMLNGAAFAIAHNHPSGDPEPSADDLSVTRRMIAASEIMDVRMLDHIVVGDRTWVSIRRRHPDFW